jgi:hypothetical protein
MPDEPVHLRDLCREGARPNLHKGKVAIMDNLAAHQSKAAEKAINAGMDPVPVSL